MLKKLFILTLMAFNAFTLSNIEANVPNGYVSETYTITKNITAFPNVFATELVPFYSFINFRESFIEIDGEFIVSNGDAIPEESFSFKVSPTPHFELSYDDIYIIFITEAGTYEGYGTDTNDIIWNAGTILAIYPSGVTQPSSIEITISLPDQSFIEQPEAEGGFLELLVGYGLYNPVGLLIIFAVTLLIANITLAFLQLPSIVYIAVNLAIGTGFLAFNFIPFWAGFIFLAVITLFLILSIRGSRI